MAEVSAAAYLCSKCEAIFGPPAIERLIMAAPKPLLSFPQNINTLHSNYEELESSALQGCSVCASINVVIERDQLGGLNLHDLKDIPFEKRDIEIFVNVRMRNRVPYELEFRMNYLGNLPDDELLGEGYSWLYLEDMSTNGLRNLNSRQHDLSRGFSDTMLRQIEEWMKQCFKSHTSCSTVLGSEVFDRRLPTRLIKIENGLKRISICETKELSRDTEYVTLSHRWGQSLPLRLKETYDQYSHSIPLNLMPKTFKEAAEVVQRLGFRYLWIDALCIIQDSHQDWLSESLTMGDVYAYGVLNLAASNAENGDGGLFNFSASKMPSVIHYRGDNENIIHLRTEPQDLWEFQVYQAPLNCRGWVVQERVLSPRIVHFTDGGLFWECCNVTAYEFAPETEVRDKKDLSEKDIGQIKFGNLNDAYEGWQAVVSAYSRCDLTKASDKLIAVAGIAKLMCKQLQIPIGDYLAGLWKGNMISELLWSNASDAGTTIYYDRAPSWPWARFDCPVEHIYNNLNDPKRVHAQLIEHKLSNASDPFNQVISGTIRLQGPLISLDDKNTRDFGFELENVSWDTDNSFDLDTWAFEKYLSIFASAVDFVQPTATALSSLVLVPSRARRGEYRRVGVLSKSVENFQDLLNCSMHWKDPDENLYLEAVEGGGFVFEIV